MSEALRAPRPRSGATPADVALALAVALGLAAIWIGLAPRTADLAAQVYRVDLFTREGFAVWDNGWFAGHHLPGYSLLFPALGSVAGTRAVGVLAVACSAALFADLARRHLTARVGVAVMWFAAAAAGDLYIGRLTFSLGIAIGLAALVALSRRRLVLATLLAAGCAAASPVAGLFAALALVAAWPELHPRGRLAPAGALAATIAGMAVLFPEGGSQPFDLGGALVGTGIATCVLAVLAPSERVLRRGAGLYAVAVLAAYVLPTPMGSNVARLGVLVAGPVLLGAARRPGSGRIVAVACAAVLVWQAWGPVTEIWKADGSPATRGAYFAPPIAVLERLGAATGRVEVVPTTTRWESVYVARHFALARGWETQLDRRYDALFYAPRLSPRRYRRWLAHNGVRFVALPDAPKERWGRAEARLVRRGAAFLQPVWSGAHWRLFAVRAPRPLARGGRLLALRPASFVVRRSRPGTVLVRVRWTRFWSAGARGCVRRTHDGFTAVDLVRGGTTAVRARWSVGAALAGTARCGAAARG